MYLKCEVFSSGEVLCFKINEKADFRGDVCRYDASPHAILLKESSSLMFLTDGPRFQLVGLIAYSTVFAHTAKLIILQIKSFFQNCLPIYYQCIVQMV